MFCTYIDLHYLKLLLFGMCTVIRHLAGKDYDAVAHLYLWFCIAETAFFIWVRSLVFPLIELHNSHNWSITGPVRRFVPPIFLLSLKMLDLFLIFVVYYTFFLVRGPHLSLHHRNIWDIGFALTQTRVGSLFTIAYVTGEPHAKLFFRAMKHFFTPLTSIFPA